MVMLGGVKRFAVINYGVEVNVVMVVLIMVVDHPRVLINVEMLVEVVVVDLFQAT